MSQERLSLSRIKTLIGKLFRVGYTVEGTLEAYENGVSKPTGARHDQLAEANRKADREI